MIAVDQQPRHRRRRAWRRAGPALASSGFAIALLTIALPRLTHTSWTTVISRVLALSAMQIGVLTLVWLAGLFMHTFVMTVSLPRLGHRRAMMLNFSGSAISNVVPFGGVLGMGVNYSMLRSWGFSKGDFTLLTALTNVVTVMSKLLLPSLALAALVVAGGGAHGSVVVMAIVALGLLCLVIGGVALASLPRSKRCSASLGSSRLLDRLAAGAGGSIADLRREALRLLRGRWHQLTLGALGYALLQALLLGLCLRALGTGLSAFDVLVGFAVGSALTLVPITPGGLGLSETSTAAVLIALGGQPAATTAAVLLFRTFTFLLEIPVGAACTAVWWMRRPQPTALAVAAGA
jgi:uncharacterized membrane protein YbhN (UPF0104 family)